MRWYSYISNDFLNRFQCNVCVSTMCFAIAVKQYFMLIPPSNASIIIDNVVEKCSLYLNMLWISFSSGKLLNKKNKSSVSILRFCFFGCENVGLKDLKFTKPPYTQKKQHFDAKSAQHLHILKKIKSFDSEKSPNLHILKKIKKSKISDSMWESLA